MPDAPAGETQDRASFFAEFTAGLRYFASTALRGFHAVVAGLTFGPYDTIFGVAGLLFLIAGATAAAPLRAAGRSAAAAEPQPAGAMDAAAGDTALS